MTVQAAIYKQPVPGQVEIEEINLAGGRQADLSVMVATDGARMEGDEVNGDRLRSGISEVLDGGQQVIVLFSVVNTSKHAILLMPPQIQLGGKQKAGKLDKHEHCSTAEQLSVIDFRLSRRRIGPGERADVLRFALV